MTLELAAQDGQPMTDTGHHDAALSIRGLTVSYGEKPAVFSLDANFPKSAMSAIIGPNGAGKSTMLKAALGIVKPLSGSIHLSGAPIAEHMPDIAYVPQRASVDWDFPARVIDVVLMGLSRELGLFRRTRKAHLDKALACLTRVGMQDFAQRQIGQLSGGQQQRVFLARALAQEAQVYLLDEPFAGVDAATEKAIISVLKSLRDAGKTVIVVHHDLATVPDYFDYVFLINMTRVAEGPVATTFTQENLQRAYGGRLGAGLIDRVAAV